MPFSRPWRLRLMKTDVPAADINIRDEAARDVAGLDLAEACRPRIRHKYRKIASAIWTGSLQASSRGRRTSATPDGNLQKKY
jgi:hypothetical protein